jgi:hypothetical protein
MSLAYLETLGKLVSSKYVWRARGQSEALRFSGDSLGRLYEGFTV